MNNPDNDSNYPNHPHNYNPNSPKKSADLFLELSVSILQRVEAEIVVLPGTFQLQNNEPN